MNDWRPLLVAFALLVIATAAGGLLYWRYWLPESTSRLARETLETIVELRQGTGRLPLRYITELERASVTRSAFDETDATEQALVENLRAAVARSPEPEALATLGLLLLDDGRLDEAEATLERVLEVEPRSVDALNGLAVVYYARAERQPQNAHALRRRGLAILRQAQAADPEDLRVLFNFGRFYEAMGMRSAALQALGRYLERDSSSTWAREAAYRLEQLQPR